MVALLERGITLAKLFPAEVVGGVGALKAFAGPFPQLRFCPTGGIDAANAPAYLAQPNVVCVGGSWMVSGDFERVEALAREAAGPRGLSVKQPALVEGGEQLVDVRGQALGAARVGLRDGADQLLEGGPGDERVPERAARLPRGEAERRVLVDRDHLAAVVPPVIGHALHDVGDRRHRGRTNVQIDPDS